MTRVTAFKKLLYKKTTDSQCKTIDTTIKLFGSYCFSFVLFVSFVVNCLFCLKKHMNHEEHEGHEEKDLTNNIFGFVYFSEFSPNAVTLED